VNLMVASAARTPYLSLGGNTPTLFRAAALAAEDLRFWFRPIHYNIASDPAGEGQAPSG
jgi:hypothetical protein